MAANKHSDQRSISEMKNLGPASEQDLNAAGILSAGDLTEIGAEESFLRMMQARFERGQSTKCCNALYLYTIYGAIHDLDWRELPEKKKNEFKKFTARLRAQGRFSS